MLKQFLILIITVLLVGTSTLADDISYNNRTGVHGTRLNGLYYIGMWKDLDGKIIYNCYIKILHNTSNLFNGIKVICPKNNNTEK
jgi:hypothetical protein